MILQEPVKTAIWHCLNHYAYVDAIFLAEQLFAEVGTDDVLFLLATAYYRSGKPKLAAVLLDNHGAHTHHCKLLHAQCYWDLKVYSKVEQILTCGSTRKGANSFKQKYNAGIMINELQKEFGESACYVLSLLGRMYLKTERRKLAEQCLNASLKLNPLLWISFQKMCEAGHKPDPQKLFASYSSLNMNVWKSHVSSHRAATQFSAPVMQNRSTGINVRESEPESNILRTRQLHNRTNQTHQAPSTSSVSSHKTTQNVEKSQPSPCLVDPIVLQLNYDNMLTPPNLKQDSLVDNLNQLPSSVCSQKDSSIIMPGHQVFRSTPSDDQYGDWHSSIAYSNSGLQPSKQKLTMTQRKISRVVSSPSTLSPISPRFGVTPLADTPSPVGERVGSMVTPVDIIQQPDVMAPVKKMVTRQSRKMNSGIHGTNPAFGKLHFSSENTGRSVTMGLANNQKVLVKSSTNNQAMPARRSTRSFANAGSAIKENNKNAAKVKQTTKRGGKSRNNEIKNEENSLCNEVTSIVDGQYNIHTSDAFDGILQVLRLIGKGYLALCQYNCREALSHLSNVPLNHRKTGWVLSMMAKAHFELNEYIEAVVVFKDLRSIAPHYTSGLEIYSTALWHLHKDEELSSLAHDLQELDRFCPETWCAVGNCFSLQRDHSSAASFFRRAIQLDPEFSYAYALLGHEKALVEDFEGALTCYRNALRWNARLYNAWYGIGTIYYKQEKYKNAELHFRKSLEINPHNSVLLCHIGIVQHSLQLTSAACDTLQAAVEMSPRNPLCKFHHANVLIAMERYEDAARELRELKEIVPKESLVYFLLGKVYKKLKQNHLAVICFSWAMDLDPKGANNQIKEAINRQHLLDDDNDRLDAETSSLEADISHLVSSDIIGSDHVFTHEGFLNRSSRIDEPPMDSDSDSL